MADPPVPNGELSGHAEHDPELIVATLDRNLADFERADADARLLACPACAALHRDLLALVRATIELPTPARPRDFTLTRDTAAALARTTAGEPASDRARLTGEMQDLRSTHAAHDRLLIANLIDRSVSASERARGEEQLAACSDCALLYDDLVALSAATHALPAVGRSRDFTLTQADAERLRVGGWRRVLAAIGSSRDVFSRPLALGLTTLGLAGLLVATIPGAIPGLNGGPTSLQVVEDAQRNAAGNGEPGSRGLESLSFASEAPAAAELNPEIAAAPPSAAASAAAAAPAPSAAEASPEILVEGGEPGAITGESEDQGPVDTYLKSIAGSESPGPSPMVIVAALLLLVGLGLFGLRWTARRVRDS